VFDCDITLDSSDPKAADYADQQVVFERVGRQLVDQTLEGYNCCLCAYGQTGTGKTHTLHGEWAHPEHKGLLPRIATELIQRLESLKADRSQCRLQVSFLEIYNNRLIDLLATADGSRLSDKKNHKLEIHTHPSIGVFVANLTEQEVRSIKDIGRLVAMGEKLRHTSQTSMNQQSSRSHTIFSFKVEVRKPNEPESEGKGALMASLKIVDLAGRENEQTSECTGEQFRELTFINRSLFHLASCINALSVGNREHVPFRNSRLTMLLADNFQRNSKTYLLATMTPSPAGYEENLLTCRFLESTGKIVTAPVANHFTSDDVASQLKLEIETMRLELGMGVLEPELQFKQDLLNYLSSTSWGRNVPAEGEPMRSIEEHLDRLEARQRAQMLRACGAVERRLAAASAGLDSLESEQLKLGAALGEAGSRLDVAQEALQELAGGELLFANRSSTPEEKRIILPPLLPPGSFPQKSGSAPTVGLPNISVTVELPPIFVL